MTDHQPERCFACGGLFARSDGAAHPYMLSTPGCWAAYGDLLTREYESPALFAAVHRLSVDAYALQHPGDGEDRRALQSVWIHYAALYLVVEGGKPHAFIPGVLRRLAGGTFPPLTPTPRFALTHADVLARPPADHAETVTAWANAAFTAWEALRDPARAMLRRLDIVS